MPTGSYCLWKFCMQNFISTRLYLHKHGDDFCFLFFLVDFNDLKLVMRLCWEFFHQKYPGNSVAFHDVFIILYLKNKPERHTARKTCRCGPSGLKLDHQFSSEVRGTPERRLPLPSISHRYNPTSWLETSAVSWPWTFQFLTCGEKVLLPVCKLSYLINKIHWWSNGNSDAPRLYQVISVG